MMPITAKVLNLLRQNLWCLCHLHGSEMGSKRLELMFARKSFAIHVIRTQLGLKQMSPARSIRRFIDFSWIVFPKDLPWQDPGQ